MRINGRVVFTLALMAVAAVALVMARQWPFKAAFFPRVTAIPLLIITTIQLLVDLFGAPAAAGESRSDLELATDVSPEIAGRRTIAISLGSPPSSFWSSCSGFRTPFRSSFLPTWRRSPVCHGG